MVLAAVDELAIVQEIEELATVDLVEGNVQAEIRIAIEQVANVVGGQQIEAGIRSVL